jgi:GxxExxY protein
MESVEQRRIVFSAAQDIWSALGPGYSESVYHSAFEVALRKQGIPYETERIIPVSYEGQNVGHVRADLIVGDTVIELKSVSRLTEQFRIQIQNYMKLLGIQKGILINFPLGLARTPEIESILIQN